VSTSSGTPAWLWWLLGAVVLALAIAIPFLLRARGRRRAWAGQLSTATAEVAWFARVLIPQLEQQPSAEDLTGGWRVASDRVAAAEDSLTALESTAPGDSEAGRARMLRDAVRSASRQLDALVQSAEPSTSPAQLAAAAAALEGAIAAISPDNPNPPA
jgi:plasmid replication initiation protein